MHSGFSTKASNHPKVAKMCQKRYVFWLKLKLAQMIFMKFSVKVLLIFITFQLMKTVCPKKIVLGTFLRSNSDCSVSV